MFIKPSCIEEHLIKKVTTDIQIERISVFIATYMSSAKKYFHDVLH